MAVTAFAGTEMDAEIIEAANQALQKSGFSLAEAIRIMVAKTARDKRLPFDAQAALEEECGDEIPNALTRETIEKAMRGEELFRAKDAEDLFRQLGI